MSYIFFVFIVCKCRSRGFAINVKSNPELKATVARTGLKRSNDAYVSPAIKHTHKKVAANSPRSRKNNSDILSKNPSDNESGYASKLSNKKRKEVMKREALTSLLRAALEE